jgi:hypothetical protein
MRRTLLRLVLLLCPLFAVSAIAAQPEITVYKSPTCGCCEAWVEYLLGEGFRVKAFDRKELNSLKREVGVTKEMASCHTATVDGYVIEGHVPAAPIRKLLAERPKTKGLAVPGMPLNSPGMGQMDGRLKTYTLEGVPYSTD